MSEPRRGTNPNGDDDAADAEPSLDAFLQTLMLSRLIERDKVGTHLTAAASGIRGSAKAFADYLVAAGELTHYQAKKLLGGRWRGMIVGRYQILAPLGRGGMGTVYLARLHRENADAASSLVALKVLPPKRAQEEERTLFRFRREMELGKHLDHPNITRTLATGEQQGVHFIAMEFVEGHSLRQRVEERGPLAAADAARLFVDVADALQHAHERGLIHRDLKPSNIMVTPEGRAKILDLGLALLVDEALPEDPTMLGGERYILGTMDYIAPEQTADATNVSPQSDLYSLGCSLYYAASGQPPFPGGTALQKMRRHRTAAAPPAESINSAVPQAFARIIEKLLAKAPADRPPTAAAVRELLMPWASAAPLPAAAVHTEREVVAEIDKPNIDPSLWEAIPVAEVDEAADQEIRMVRPGRKQPRQQDTDTQQALIFVFGGCALICSLVLLAILVSLLQRL
ncbi:MAG TPA: serine/threonine-protein kinase [Urbifossiella sp.]|nr:serine/threonine-protein kinase [Urbifossiella sp.]